MICNIIQIYYTSTASWIFWMQFYTRNLFCNLLYREMYSKYRKAPAIRLTKVNRVAVFNLYLMAVLLLWYLMLVVSCICRINALRRSLLYFLFITSWGVHYTTSNPLVSIYISIRFIFWNIWAPLILVYNKYLIMCRTLIENIEYTCSLKSSFIHSAKFQMHGFSNDEIIFTFFSEIRSKIAHPSKTCHWKQIKYLVCKTREHFHPWLAHSRR